MAEEYTCIECENLYDDTDGDTDERMCNKCLNEEWECVECGDLLSRIQDNMDERTCMTCVLKKEDPDVITTLKKESEVNDA